MPLHNRYFAALAVAAFLSGCGASSSGPLPAAGTEALQHRGSWMAGGLAGHDLLYVSNRNGTVSVFRYCRRRGQAHVL